MITVELFTVTGRLKSKKKTTKTAGLQIGVSEKTKKKGSMINYSTSKNTKIFKEN